MAYRQVTVGTTPTLIAAYNPKRDVLVIRNYAGATCFIHDSQVDITAKGFPLAEGEVVSFLEKDGDEPSVELWGQTVAGTADLRIYESFKEK
jgi:hypothetical protein